MQDLPETKAHMLPHLVHHRHTVGGSSWVSVHEEEEEEDDDDGSRSDFIDQPRSRLGSICMGVGNHLRTVHPRPILSDQLILVPSLFGSNIIFADLRDELEPILRDKYSNGKLDWSLGQSFRGDPILTTYIVKGGKSVFEVEKATTNENEAAGGTNNGDALMEVARRVCQYFSIDLASAIVNAGFRIGQPFNSARPAHSSHHGTNCFVIVTFGSPRKLLLRQGTGPNDPQLRLPLDDNSATAMLVDITHQGWLYSIDNLTGEELQDELMGGGGETRPETITMYISGTCTTMRRVSSPAPNQRTFANGRRRSSAGSDGGRASLVSNESPVDDSNEKGDPHGAASWGFHGERSHQPRRSSAPAAHVGVDAQSGYSFCGGDGPYYDYYYDYRRYYGEPPYPDYYNRNSSSRSSEESYEARRHHHRRRDAKEGERGESRTPRSRRDCDDHLHRRSRSRSRSASSPPHHHHHHHHHHPSSRSDSRC